MKYTDVHNVSVIDVMMTMHKCTHNRAPLKLTNWSYSHTLTLINQGHTQTHLWPEFSASTHALVPVIGLVGAVLG